jgi:ATP synthase protein I
VVNGKEPDDRERMREEHELGEAVERARRRREHWLQTGEWPLGRALAMMGRFGWTMVGPILLAAFLGRWLDRTFNTGVFWSATLVFSGAAAGFWAVWKRMNSE